MRMIVMRKQTRKGEMRKTVMKKTDPKKRLNGNN